MTKGPTSITHWAKGGSWRKPVGAILLVLLLVLLAPTTVIVLSPHLGGQLSGAILAAVIGAVLLLPLIVGVVTTSGTQLKPTLFRWARVAVTVFFAIEAASLTSNVWHYVATSTATPGGKAVINVVANNSEPNTAFQHQLSGKLPANWQTRPFNDKPARDSGTNGTGPAVSEGAQLVLPSSALPSRHAFWVPAILRQVMWLTCLGLAYLALSHVITSGPFVAPVYRSLRLIAIVAIAGGLAIDLVSTHMLNDFYASLDLSRFGVNAYRDGSSSAFNPLWLVVFGVVEILRYGCRLQAEQDATV